MKFSLLIDFELELNSRGRHLEKSIWRHISALAVVRYGWSLAILCRISCGLRLWSKSKPEEEFQYGGRLFLKNGNSYISAMNWVILTIFGVPFEESDVTQSETWIKIVTQRPPS